MRRSTTSQKSRERLARKESWTEK
jgi:hypothetical protein